LDKRTIKPAEARVSYYNIDPKELKMRAADLPGLTSVKTSDLFPGDQRPVEAPMSEAMRAEIRRRTLASFEKIDLSKVRPGDSVNILTSHHGYSIHGGHAYAEMVRTLRDEVQRRTGATDIRLRAGVGLRFRETEEYIAKFGLDEYFQGKAKGIAPVDRGVPIRTAIGTLYGIAEAYDARWIIHAHNNDVRELHYHRQMGRLFKPFAMSYATIETRSSYHQSIGPRSANLLPRLIWESEYVQKRFLCSCMLQVGPEGIMGVDASADLVTQDKEFARLNLQWYGKIITLLGAIKEVVLVIDYPGPIPYTVAGGVLFGNFLNANVDEFDLRKLTPFTRYSDMLYPGKTPLVTGVLPPPNPAIKAVVLNYCSKGYPGTFFPKLLPMWVVGAQAELMENDEQNAEFMNHAIKVEDLPKAMAFARNFAKTDNVLVFDGAVGGFNVSESLAEVLYTLAPQISEQVDRELMPLWLKQRAIAIAA